MTDREIVERLPQLRELLAKATKGPWTSLGYCGFRIVGSGDKPRYPKNHVCQLNDESTCDDANADLIAAARNTLPSLLDLIESQAREIAELRARVIEECARVAACHADDRAGRDRPLDWHDGYQDGCQGAADAIRTLATTPEQEVEG